MSRLSELPRLPAHAGLLPDTPVYRPAPAHVARMLRAAIPGATRIEELASSAEGGEGRFFRVDTGPSGAPLFLKLMCETEYGAIAEAEAIIASFPAESPAVRSCGVFRLAGSPERVAVAYPYLDAAYLAPAKADMRRLGQSIAALHSLLHGIGEVAAIRRRARERAERLEAALARRAAHRDMLGDAPVAPLPGGLAAAVEGAAAQPLHGDLNVGNILRERGSGAVRFLDFEDVRHSYGSPILDLALPVERFCLLLDDDGDAVAAAVELLRGYAERAMPPLNPGLGLARALNVINLRAIALLIERREAGLETPHSEWEKFGALLCRHAQRAGAIAAIERAAGR